MTTTTPVPGSPFHRLARTPAHRWWLTVLGTLAILVGWSVGGSFLVGIDLTVASGVEDGAIDLPTWAVELISTTTGMAAIALLTPLVLLAARLFQRRRPGTVSSVTGRLRWRWLGTCALIAVGTSLAGMAGTATLLSAYDITMFDGDFIGWTPFLISMAVLAAIIPFQASAEEYLCRGWILQAVGGRAPWLAVAVQALVFAVAHGWQGGWAFVFFLVFGAVAGVLTVRTGGLEAGIGLHVVNNIVVISTYTASGVLDQIGKPSVADWQHIVVDALMVGVYLAVVLWLARRRGIATTTVPASTPAQQVPVAA